MLNSWNLNFKKNIAYLLLKIINEEYIYVLFFLRFIGWII